MGGPKSFFIWGGTAQLSHLLFILYSSCSRYVAFVELIRLDDLLDNVTFLFSTNQKPIKNLQTHTHTTDTKVTYIARLPSLQIFLYLSLWITLVLFNSMCTKIYFPLSLLSICCLNDEDCGKRVIFIISLKPTVLILELFQEYLNNASCYFWDYNH